MTVADGPSADQSDDTRGQYLHIVIQVLDDALNEVFSTSELGQMVESGEDLELLHQPEPELQ